MAHNPPPPPLSSLDNKMLNKYLNFSIKSVRYWFADQPLLGVFGKNLGKLVFDS